MFNDTSRFTVSLLSFTCVSGLAGDAHVLFRETRLNTIKCVVTSKANMLWFRLKRVCSWNTTVVPLVNPAVAFVSPEERCCTLPVELFKIDLDRWVWTGVQTDVFKNFMCAVDNAHRFNVCPGMRSTITSLLGVSVFDGTSSYFEALMNSPYTDQYSGENDVRH